MILTLTLNPALDVSTRISALLPEKKLRCETPTYQPGGGGINVSRALTRLGTTNKAMYMAGGPTGQRITTLLAAEKVAVLPLEIEAWTREDITVVDNATGSQYRFNFPGLTLPSSSQMDVLNAITNRAPFPSYVVVSGSFPPGFPVGFLKKLKMICDDQGAKLVVDTSGPGLLAAAKAGVFLLKPNYSELCELAGIEKQKIVNVEKVARQVTDQYGVGMMVISLGAKGASILNEGRFYHIHAPHLPVKSTVGAGDSMLAGVLHGLTLGASTEEVLKWGVACGTATTMNEGTSLFKPQQVVKVKRLID